MKNLLSIIAAILILFACESCGNKSSQESNINITDTEYCNQLRNYGAADVHIDRKHGVLLYGVKAYEVSDNPNDVARIMYEDAYSSGIRGIDECRVVELPSGKVLGKYKK